MTQAFNLSQLANKVNTSGQLDASTGLYNQVPVANGGTGKSSVTSGRLLVGAGTSAMTELAGTTAGDAVTWNGTAWVSGTVGGSMPGIVTYVAPGTWTKPASIKGIKVTVVGAGGSTASIPPGVPNAYSIGAGGGGGAAIEYISAPSIPGPVAVTAGSGTNSFGAFCSATAGSAGVAAPATATAGGSGGSGSGGNINIVGDGGSLSSSSASITGNGGTSILGGGGIGRLNAAAIAGGNYGGGASGICRSSGTTLYAGAAGAPGIVIIEEFY